MQSSRAISTESRRRIRWVVIASAFLLGALFTQVARLDVRRAKVHQAQLELVETSYVPPSGALRLVSIGHEQFVADLLFIRAFSYFMDHLFGDRTYEWLDTYIDTIIALDPYNPAVYRWATQVVKYGQLITNEDIERSIHYAELGAERFPNDWRFWLDIGFNYYFEWRSGDPEERRRMRDKALDYFAVASLLPGSQLDPNFVTALYMQKDDKKMALFHAYQRYFDASDKERAELIKTIRELETDEAVSEIVEEDKEWKETFPFVSRSFFSFLGPRKIPTVPRTWSEIDEAYRAIAKDERPAHDEEEP